MKHLIIILLLASCVNLEIEHERNCEEYNNYINALYDKKLEILFETKHWKYNFKGEIKVIEKERWDMLVECEK